MCVELGERTYAGGGEPYKQPGRRPLELVEVEGGNGDKVTSLLSRSTSTTSGAKSAVSNLTIARQIASIALALWRSGEAYDPKRREATE